MPHHAVYTHTELLRFTTTHDDPCSDSVVLPAQVTMNKPHHFMYDMPMLQYAFVGPQFTIKMN